MMNTPDNPVSIFDYSLDDLQNLCSEINEPPFRSTQLWKGLYRHLYDSYDGFSNLPKNLRNKLSDAIPLSSLSPLKTIQSSDGETTKTLFRLHDDNAVETVLMRYNERRTLCISTQVGCAAGCVFCATGRMGFTRNLSSGEIIEQILYFARQLNKEDDKVTNVVFMGMGEPFHNYAAVRNAIDILNHPDGFSFGERRFTISTVGLVPSIIRFAKEKTQVNLAISLHAANDVLRSSLVPINKKYPIQPLMDACRQYVDLTHRRITFEWALIQDVNDSKKDAAELSNLLGNLLCHVNLIPLNPTNDYKGQAVNKKRAKAFQNYLLEAKIPCTVRLRRGLDIQAGCGQLATIVKGKE